MNNAISIFLQERIDARDFPSAVYLVAEKGEIAFQDALGYAVAEPERLPATLDTIYDLASLTKPLVTGLIAAHLIERSEVDPEKTVGYYFPEFDGFSGFSDFDALDTLVSELLTHTSGAQAWKPFYLFTKNRSEVLAEIFRTEPLLTKPEVVYSDLGFLTLMFLLERVAGQEIGSLAESIVITPLELGNTFFSPDATLKSRIAASEKGNEYERRTCAEKFPEIRIPHSALRSSLIWGEVHDGNAWFMGGVAGHAGLFSTAEEVFKLALQFLPQYTQLLKPETCELFRTNFTPGMNEDRSFAFQLASTKDSTSGKGMSLESFGHLGFTGTSLWIDPVKERIFILLTNRTHARSLPFANINSVRRRFHDLANELLDEKN